MKTPKTPRCWMGSVEAARVAHGDGSPQHLAALDHPGTCLLPDGHAGPHEFIFDGDIVIEFVGTDEGGDRT